MEDTHFDAMVKALGSLTTRRLTLGALMGGELGRLGLADVGAKKSGKCKPKCDECEKCHKGSCKTKNGKKRFTGVNASRLVEVPRSVNPAPASPGAPVRPP